MSAFTNCQPSPIHLPGAALIPVGAVHGTPGGTPEDREEPIASPQVGQN